MTAGRNNALAEGKGVQWNCIEKQLIKVTLSTKNYDGVKGKLVKNLKQ